MKKHKWQKIEDPLLILNYSKCIKCNIYRIIFETSSGYRTFYSYELPEVELRGYEIYFIAENNATQSAPSCITSDDINNIINENKG